MQQKLSNIDFRKEEGLTKIVVEYSEPFARKVHYPSDRGTSEMLDKIREIEGNILAENYTLKEQSFISGNIGTVNHIYRIKKDYTTKRFAVSERFSDYYGYGGFGCVFDIENLENEKLLHANFPVILPDKKYSLTYMYLANKRKKINICLLTPEVAGNMINEFLSVSPQQVAAKVC